MSAVQPNLTVSAAARASQADSGGAPTSDGRSWQLALQVIDLARGLIVSQNPFLSSAVGLLKPAPAQLDVPFACDGGTLLVDAGHLLKGFSDTREAPVHDLAHVLLHCVLLHPFVGSSVDGPAWDLAADIVAELIAAEIVGARTGERGAKIAAVRKQLVADLGEPLTTERLYRALADGAYESARRQWATLFYVDDHGLWPSAGGASGDGKAGDAAGTQGQGASATGQQGPSARPAQEPAQAEAPGQDPRQARDTTGAGQRDALPGEDGREADGDASGDGADETPNAPGAEQPAGRGQDGGPMTDTQRSQAEKAWSRAAKSLRVNLETISRTRGAGLAGLVKELEVGAHQRVDYRSFLRQFAVEHEDMRLSDDEFDYVFYTYGLELYGDMPLVEPLEYRHEKRIRDFAIVIDTSSSVSDKVVQEFVNTTFDVLSSEGGFFSKTNIHIIQADARVQSDAKITSLADLDRWRRNIKLHGFGGTDFRPAFAYVQQLRQQGEFDDLQGLLYFTDGWGIYPDRMPPYKCAFVFYDEDHRPELVPPWAIQVVLHPGQYESLSVY